MANENYLDIANSPLLWLAAGFAVLIVIVQAVIFAKKSYSTGTKIGLTKGQMNHAIKSSAITAIGPSLVVLSALLALLVVLGGPISWMRLAFIGSAPFEMAASSFGAEAVGVKMGTDPMTPIAFANAVWTMTTGSIGWIIMATLTADKMGLVQKKLEKKDPKMMGIIASGAILAAFGIFSANQIVTLNKNSVACISGGFIMFILTSFAAKKKIHWLREWALLFALLGGMGCAVLWPA